MEGLIVEMIEILGNYVILGLKNQILDDEDGMVGR
jgi:hypothetical protein